MIGILLFVAFLILGIGICNTYFSQYPVYTRAWIGTLTGILGLMWGVIPFALFFKFSILSHILALLFMAGLFGVTRYYLKDQKPQPIKKDKVFYSLLYVVVPITILTGILLYSHTLMPGKNGGLYVGQSTFGDLCLHLGITTSIATQGTFPPDYSIFPGQRLSYPFLVDSLSSSLYLFGTPLRWAVLLPSYVLVIMLVTGFFLFAYEILRNRHGAVFASVLFFFNGGFGFIYFLDGLKKNKANFTRIFTEFYQTPTNLTGNNIRWVNVLCDMIIPQRTTLAGWTFLFLALWLLYKAIQQEDRKLFICAGVVAGLMPMIHTHSFMGFGIISILWCFVYFFQFKNKKKYIIHWSYFALIAAVLALPQLFYWTFPQSTGGSFVKWKFDWANDSDPWLWFWVKNVGLVFILLIPALAAATKKTWSLYSGALAVFAIAELVLFQPNPYDNNKLFYIWYAFTVIIVTAFLWNAYEKLKGVRGRWLLMAFVLALCTFSAGLTLVREKVSSYMIFDKSAVAASEFIKASTPEDALFITSDNHNNPVSSLTGRNVFSGTPVYLNFHGIKYDERAREVESMFKNPSSFKTLADQNKIDYVYFSNYEKDKYKVDNKFFKDNYPLIFSQGDVYIFAVSERAQKYLQK